MTLERETFNICIIRSLGSGDEIKLCAIVLAADERAKEYFAASMYFVDELYYGKPWLRV